MLWWWRHGVVLQVDVVFNKLRVALWPWRCRYAVLALSTGCGSEEESEVGVCARWLESRRCCATVRY
jgi:hypothetical protein